jgi:hypothetical protein
METFCSTEYFEDKPDDYKKDKTNDQKIMINGNMGATLIPVTVKNAPKLHGIPDNARVIFWSEIKPFDDERNKDIWDLTCILECTKVENGIDKTYYIVADFDYDSGMVLDQKPCRSLRNAYNTFKDWRDENMTTKKESLKHA